MTQINHTYNIRVNTPQSFYSQPNTINSNQSKPESSDNLSEHKQFQIQQNKMNLGLSEIPRKGNSESSSPRVQILELIIQPNDKQLKKNELQDRNRIDIQRLKNYIQNIKQTFNQQKSLLQYQMNILKATCYQLQKKYLGNEGSQYSQKQQILIKELDYSQNFQQKSNQSSLDISLITKSIYQKIENKCILIQNLQKLNQETAKDIQQIKLSLEKVNQQISENKRSITTYQQSNQRKLKSVRQNIKRIISNLNKKIQKNPEEQPEESEHRSLQFINHESQQSKPRKKVSKSISLIISQLPNVNTFSKSISLKEPSQGTPRRIRPQSFRAKKIKPNPEPGVFFF